MRILITGGAGYLGYALQRHIHNARPALELFATYHFTPPPPNRVSFVELDLCDSDSVGRILRACRPNVIVNCAARMQGSLEVMRGVNSTAAGRLADMAKAIDARFIHLSSDVVFDGRRGNYNEQDSPNPLTDYARSKFEAELLVTASGGEGVIVRTSLIYGFTPLDPRTRTALNGDGPALFTDERRCPIWVETLCAAILELCEGDYTGILHVAGEQALSRYEFGVKLVRALGGDAGRLKPARSVDSGLNRPLDCTLDCSTARRLLDTKLPGLDQVLDLATY